MNPERWQQTKRLYNSALELEPDRREAFLQEACAGDEALRKQIEHLLAVEKDAHVRTHVSLLVDDAETNASIALIEIVEQRIERRTFGLDRTGRRVREQRRRQLEPRQPALRGRELPP